MRRFSISLVALLLFTAPSWAGPFTTAGIPYDSPAIKGWATGVADLVRGPRDISNPASPLASFGVPGNALGVADGTFGVVRLGDGGQITVTFARPIINGAGADFAVFENGFAFQGLIFAELAFVEVSADGVNFVRFPASSLTPSEAQVGSFGLLDPTDINNLAGKHEALLGTPFDLSEVGLSVATHVRLVDVVGSIDPAFASQDQNGNAINDPWPTNFASGGFDLDAVAVFHEAPEPASLGLLALAGILVGCPGFRNRQTSRVSRRRSMMRWTALLLGLLTLALTPGLAVEDDVKAEMQKLQGTWTVVSAEREGQPLDRIKGGTLTIKDVNFLIKTQSGAELKGDLRIDPKQKPKTMDLAHQEGVLVDKTWQAIYQLDGDDLKLCYAEADSGKDRPKDFTTEPESSRMLVVMKREKQ